MKPRYLFVITIFLALVAFFLWFKIQTKLTLSNKISTASQYEIKYIPLGDSYTIGLGVTEENRWPNILINHLRDKGINIALIANPAISGYTIEDAINFELPVVKTLKPDFVTVLIGANDSFQGKDPLVFQKRLNELLDKLQIILTNPKNIVLITLPDHSKTPAFFQYQNQTENISQFINLYNQIIKKEGEKRGLTVADIFLISQTVTDYKDYILDGLHPSAQGYQKWEKIIFPVVFKKIQESF